MPRLANPMSRIVVKIGTNTITDADGIPDPVFLADIGRQIAMLRQDGHEVVLVTSGAIGAGKAALGFKENVRDVRLRQACAAVGQSRLMAMWQDAFAPHGIQVAQMLLTYGVFSHRKSYLHARAALLAILDLGVIPVINENDAIAIDEIDTTFGDNDKLAALVAAKMESTHLVILSDVPGLYDRHPKHHADAHLIPEVKEITPAIAAAAGDSGSAGGRGGMRTKLEAARIAMESGISMVIARGRDADVLSRIFRGEAVGTRFIPQDSRLDTKKRWIQHAAARGRISVDEGAARALKDGKHLLPAGVTAVRGNFDVESVVEIVLGDRVLAKAVSRLSSDDVRRVRGAHSDEAAVVLGVDSASVNITRKGALVLL